MADAADANVFVRLFIALANVVPIAAIAGVIAAAAHKNKQWHYWSHI